MRDSSDMLSVYVVDDDEAVLDSFVVLLEAEGFAVRPSSSADGFLADLEQASEVCNGSGCLLLDLNMPGKGGLEVMAALAERNCSLPVVVMSGSLDERAKSRALKNGATAVLKKPVDADLLIKTLRNAVSC